MIGSSRMGLGFEALLSFFVGRPWRRSGRRGAPTIAVRSVRSGLPPRHLRCRLRRLPSDSLGRIEVAPRLPDRRQGLPTFAHVRPLGRSEGRELASPAGTGCAGSRSRHTRCGASRGAALRDVGRRGTREVGRKRCDSLCRAAAPEQASSLKPSRPRVPKPSRPRVPKPSRPPVPKPSRPRVPKPSLATRAAFILTRKTLRKPKKAARAAGFWRAPQTPPSPVDVANHAKHPLAPATRAPRHHEPGGTASGGGGACRCARRKPKESPQARTRLRTGGAAEASPERTLRTAIVAPPPPDAVPPGGSRTQIPTQKKEITSQHSPPATHH